MLAAGVDPDSRDTRSNSPLCHAAGNGDIRNTRLLLEYRSDVLATTRDGNTALMLAARHGSLELIAMLLDAGAEKRLRNYRREMAEDIATAAGHACAAEQITAHRNSGDWRPDWT